LAPGTITEDARDDTRQKPFDVAADSRGRVLLLDSNSHKVRVFERKG
jgi:NHL repeat